MTSLMLIKRTAALALTVVGFAAIFMQPANAQKWAGPYIGLNAGWLWSETEADVKDVTGFTAITFPSDLDNDADGFIGGVQVGANNQYNGWTLGFEGDIAFTDADERTAITLAPGAQNPRTTTLTTEMDWFATFRVRLGMVASPNLLVYVTGGAAFANIDHEMTSEQVGNPIGQIRGTDDSNFTAGWTAGLGTEWAWDSVWSVKAEYLYYDLGDTNVTLDNASGLQVLNYEIENTGHIARIGVNYKFWRLAPEPLK